MRSHVQIGYDLVSRIPFFRDAADLVLSHRHGTTEPAIPEACAVADAFDAMTSPRPYQATRRVSQAIEEIALKTGRQFVPQVVQRFLGIPTEVLKGIHGEQKDERSVDLPQDRRK